MQVTRLGWMALRERPPGCMRLGPGRRERTSTGEQAGAAASTPREPSVVANEVAAAWTGSPASSDADTAVRGATAEVAGASGREAAAAAGKGIGMAQAVTHQRPRIQ